MNSKNVFYPQRSPSISNPSSWALIIGLVLFTVSYTASAFTLRTCNGANSRWAGSSASLSAAANSFPSGNAFRTSLNTSVARINQNPAAFDFTLSFDDPGIGFNNNQNEIWFASGFGAPALATTRFNTNTCEILEVDIQFDNTVNYTTSMSKTVLLSYSGSNRAFQNTAIHELGHALGLQHTADTYNIMGQDWSHTHANGSTTRSYFGEDASNGAVALYGNNPALVQDLSVAHWRRTGASGGYSVHNRTRILTSAGGSVPGITINGEPGFRVNKGQSYLAEFSYENNGETSLTTEVGYYISTDDFIFSNDTRIGGRNGMFLGRNTVLTFQAPVTIPNNLVSGTNYWLGAIINEDDTLVEVTSINNRTYIPIRIN